MTRYRDMLPLSEFEQAVSRTRLTAPSVEIGRDYLVNGLNLREAARKHGVTPERVRQIVAKISNRVENRSRRPGKEEVAQQTEAIIQGVEAFRAKYKGKSWERYNKCIRVEFEGGNELMELRRYVSYLRNVKPMWDTTIEETRKMLNSIKKQTPKIGRFGPLLKHIDHFLNSRPMAGGTREAWTVLAEIETILNNVRDEIITEIKVKYGF